MKYFIKNPAIFAFAFALLSTLLLASCVQSNLDGVEGDSDMSTETDGDLDLTSDIDFDDQATGDDESDQSEGDLPDGNDTAEKEEEIDLTCTYRCLVVEDVIDFGAVPPMTCKTVDVQMTSGGQLPLTIISVALSPDTDSVYQLVELTKDDGTPVELDYELAPQRGLVAKIQYCPQAITDASGTLVIGSNDEVRQRREVELTMDWKGNSTLAVEPGEILWGDRQADGTTPYIQYYKIKANPDPGDATRPLEIKRILLINQDVNFELPTQVCAPRFFLSPGEERSCSIIYRPRTLAAHAETLKVVGNDGERGDQEAQISLSGTGVGPTISVQPTNVDFGYVLIDKNAATSPITVRNDGTGALSFTTPVWTSNTGGAFGIVDSNSLFTTGLEAGTQSTFVLTFDPSEDEVIYTGSLKISSNDRTTPDVHLSVVGFGASACPPGMTPPPDNPDGAQCVANCEEGTIICWPEEGAGYYVCGSNNDLIQYTECEPGKYCKDGTCVDKPCVPGERTCFEGDLLNEYLCNELGTGYEAVPCETVNECRPSYCRAGESSSCKIEYAVVNTPCNDGKECFLDDKCSAAGECVGTAKDCNDDNDCTDDECQEGIGCKYTKHNGDTCDDHSSCTNNDHCVDGECQGDVVIECNDHNPCTDDVCDPEADPPCSFVFNTRSCNDSNLCTVGDVCVNGACMAGTTSLDCNDSNPCTSDNCSAGSGCTHTNLYGYPCEDGNSCTINDQCLYDSWGHVVCIAGSTIDCDDDNPCTVDGCDENGGCTHVNATDGTTCSDGDAKCTINDACQEGVCVGQPKVCNDGNPCTDDSCNTTYGCIYTANALTCDDGNPCTVGDYCYNKTCSRYTSTLSCFDDNPCTNDSCSATACTGPDCQPEDYCVNNPVTNGTSCNDGNQCTTGDRCLNGACTPTGGTDCNDSNPCTRDECDLTVVPPASPCKHVALVGESCNDNDPCTVGDACNSNGQCLPGTSQLDCADTNSCTLDFCQSGVGCIHQNQSGTSCEDGNACTVGDLCSIGRCVSGTTRNCEDGNPCTDNYCNTTSGCYSVNNAAACSDSNACTIGDVCADGTCKSGTLDSCNDGNECTNDTCDPVRGCQYSNLPSSTTCDDESACTTGDHCSNGTCVGTPVSCDDSNICTLDSCAASTGCAHDPDPSVTFCDDGNVCTSNDRCNAGVCSGTTRDCSDGNICTTDTCDPSKPYASACVNAYNTVTCDDAQICTYNDRCNGNGVCVGTTITCSPNECQISSTCNGTSSCTVVNKTNGTTCSDEGNVCTQNVCQAGQCSHPAVPNSPETACASDSDPCTKDVCVSGACSHPAVSDSSNVACATDSNSCTTDVCRSGECSHINVANGTSCDSDYNVCTTDSCQNGECAHSGLSDGTSCTVDGNQCTYDVCMSGYCNVSLPNGSGCNDSRVCTTNDRCYNGGCIGDNVANGTLCDDGSSSTIDDKCTNGTCAGTTNFTIPGDCPGRLDMVKIVGTRVCIDKYESLVCRTSSCSSLSNCKGQDSDDYDFCFGGADGGTFFCTGDQYLACSVAGVTPSRYLNYDQAKEACENNGKRLCTGSNEWEKECTRSGSTTYPYGSSYQSSYCNGVDYADPDNVRSTGSLSQCTNAWGAYDQSGNLWEWTSSNGGCSSSQRRLRGGSYSSASDKLACTYSECTEWDINYANVGARCCLDY